MITLLGENIYGGTPSRAELELWADTFGITHPVVADGGWNETFNYLNSYSFALPTMHQLAQGMELVRKDTYVSESQVQAELP